MKIVFITSGPVPIYWKSTNIVFIVNLVHSDSEDEDVSR